MRQAFLVVLAAAALGCVLVAGAAAQSLNVAAAADLQSVLPELAARFERETAQKVALTFGSSGNFYTQIRNGAPFDLFLSADVEYPERLEAAGLTEPGSLYEYARGRIVLWTRSDSGIDVTRGLQAVAEGSVRRIAVASPEHAPYGRAAVAALKAQHLYDDVRSKLIIGENISQAAQFAQSGSADVGIIALSLALAPALKRSGRYSEVPERLYPPIRQAAVVMAASRRKLLARRFIEELRKPNAVKILASYGFAMPEPLRR